MLHKAWNSKGEMPYCFPRSSVKFQGHTVQSITDFDPNWAFPDYRPVAAFKSLRFALFIYMNESPYFKDHTHSKNLKTFHYSSYGWNIHSNKTRTHKWQSRGKAYMLICSKCWEKLHEPFLFISLSPSLSTFSNDVVLLQGCLNLGWYLSWHKINLSYHNFCTL